MSWIVIAGLGGLILVGGLFILIFWLLGKGGEE
jgi:hypothetical protein